MELSNHPRHRKRFLSGFGATSGLFGTHSRATNVALAEAVNNLPMLSAKILGSDVRAIKLQPTSFEEPRVASLNLLADQICQEACGSVSATQLTQLSKDRKTVSIEKMPTHNHRKLRAWPALDPTLTHVPRLSGTPVKPMSDVTEWQLAHIEGAVVVRNRLTQISEISSRSGEKIRFTYGAEGDLRSYTRRLPSGQIHSSGEVDGDSIVVRDGAGQVVLIGESMSVSDSGQLAIKRRQGQFLRVDLISETYTERRVVRSEPGNICRLTAMFALDGFRMHTHFQVLKIYRQASDEISEETWNAPETHQSLRFYGRDGSVLEFDSIDKVRLQQNFHAMSFMAQPSLPDGLPGLTAWDSANSYVKTQPSLQKGLFGKKADANSELIK